jgi:hypothetical protein
LQKARIALYKPYRNRPKNFSANQRESNVKRSDLMDVICVAQSAMQNVLDNWEKGDLAGAIRNMESVLHEQIEPTIQWWESDQ